MAEKFSLKDHLFNEQTVGQLAAEYAAGVAGFDAQRFSHEALAGFPERELMARMDWMADCLERQLARDFSTMADQLQSALADPLDPTLTDDDFGHFIHATPGILAVRHGLENHRSRAMTLLHQATQRFSMEFYIRAFINRWPEETLAQLVQWATDENYHVRRLVSEGTRPRLPWAQNVRLTPEQTFPLLDMLHADPTRFVTRSVANHLNDLSKIVPDAVLDRLARWHRQGKQQQAELAWMRRHALRTLIKQGHEGAMAALGYRADAPVSAEIFLADTTVKMGETLAFEVTLNSAENVPVLIDYRIDFMRAGGKRSEKVFKLKAAELHAGKSLKVKKAHRFKGDATTFTLYEGAHRIIVQVNGRDVTEAAFELTG
ncbi:DNA alkylation repair protein [Sulfitobacter sp. F26169L]|uniref:DNA alkylation repair protein n=1 Tax=Sulfitobacter sp. F26169L TaxID=2996015 RepID=UPI002260ECC7|nr:DNA alkylation repair protein [Sulfitobacter sp. F26169L]MCX7566229.1 DNA alkylation repair protein [Sulfitobacter sp. F26169L]